MYLRGVAALNLFVLDNSLLSNAGINKVKAINKATMDTSKTFKDKTNIIRRLRKKLRQIEKLERLERELSIEEERKVGNVTINIFRLKLDRCSHFY